MERKSKQKSLGLNALLNGIRTILNLLFPLITFPYVSRVLQVENIGKFHFALSVTQYFLMIAALGITTYAIREGTKFRDNSELFDRFASEVFSINLVSTITAYILIFLCIFIIPKFYEYKVLILIFSIEVIFTTIGTEWIYSIFEEYAYITVRSIAFKAISVVLLLLLVKKPEDYIIYAEITVFANVGSNILNFIHAKKYCRIKPVWNSNCKKHLTPVLVIFASTVATTIYVNSDTTMLGFMASDYEVGIYSVSVKIYKIVKQLLASVLVVSVPRLALLMGQKKMDEYKKIFIKIFNVLILMALPAVTGLFLMSKEIVLLISGFDYIRAKSSLQLLSIALVFCVFGWIFNQCVLIPAKKEKIVLIAAIITTAVNIVLNLFLIPVWKENAVAFSTVIAEGIMMAICMYNGMKIIRLDKGVLQNFVSVAFGCAAICFICIFIRKLRLPDITSLCLSIPASVIGYGCVLLLFRNQLVTGLIKSFFIRQNHQKIKKPHIE